jgi:hypothetical protein
MRKPGNHNYYNTLFHCENFFKSRYSQLQQQKVSFSCFQHESLETLYAITLEKQNNYSNLKKK